MNILTTIYSWAFLAGAVSGVVLMRAAQYAQCKWADQHSPLPGGRKRTPGALSRAWVGGLIAVGTLGYVLLQVGQTESRYQGRADRVERCNAELIRAATDKDNIREKYDRLSIEQRNHLTDLDAASGAWVHRLVTPPERLAGLPFNDPARYDYFLTITKVYSDRTSELRQRIAEIREEQTALQKDLADHPLPSPSCDDVPK
jgi:hypothetical protein